MRGTNLKLLSFALALLIASVLLFLFSGNRLGVSRPNHDHDHDQDVEMPIKSKKSWEYYAKKAKDVVIVLNEENILQIKNDIPGTGLCWLTSLFSQHGVDPTLDNYREISNELIQDLAVHDSNIYGAANNYFVRGECISDGGDIEIKYFMILLSVINDLRERNAKVAMLPWINNFVIGFFDDGMNVSEVDKKMLDVLYNIAASLIKKETVYNNYDYVFFNNHIYTAKEIGKTPLIL